MPPITPAEAEATKEVQIPEVVFDAFNKCITKYLDKGRAEFKFNEVVTVLVALGLKREDIVTNKWLNVEDIYRNVGWEVSVDLPGFNESYEGTICFTKSLRRAKMKGS
ncbi:hypothetical protein KBA63_00970 [Candidatus Woesebacteria bacterium]|nr:hypothetical protein [Candidatus Woesebacteria bacterium]MBP9687213.1 hypothetical protein [Candidatus Woesebacteria bacterium]